MSIATQLPIPSLSELYRQTRKPTDIFFNVYLCRPIALVFVRALLPTRVTPNQVTLFSLGLALASCAGLAWGPWPAGLWGGVALFELSYVFDKVDGMLARARGTASQSGQLLDFLMDEIKALALLAAVGFGAYRQHHEVEYLLAAMAGIVALGVGLSITTFQRRPEVLGDNSSKVSEPVRNLAGKVVSRAVRLAEQLGRFGIHYPSYLWLAAVFSDARLYLVPYIAVNLAYCSRSLAGLVWRYGRFS